MRELSAEIPEDLALPNEFGNPHLFDKGVLVIQAPPFTDYQTAQRRISNLCDYLGRASLDQIPLIVLADDSRFTAATENNFVWVTFTRANPSHDIYGVKSFVEYKHWGCRGPLVIDARIKPHHAPELIPDKGVSERADRFFQKGGVLEKWG
jgi:4-hydroxy-3-polyprenylbenzoate decarboxylase